MKIDKAMNNRLNEQVLLAVVGNATVLHHKSAIRDLFGATIRTKLTHQNTSN